MPNSLVESARIDGARHFTVLFRIIVPLSLPSIAVIILYYGVAHWNNWFHAMIFLQTAREKISPAADPAGDLLQNTMQDSTATNG